MWWFVPLHYEPQILDHSGTRLNVVLSKHKDVVMVAVRSGPANSGTTAE
jgi:hypothetical protein